MEEFGFGLIQRVGGLTEVDVVSLGRFWMPPLEILALIKTPPRPPPLTHTNQACQIVT
jgi:hypothetical protein